MTATMAGRLGYVCVALIVLATILGRLDWLVGVILWIIVVLLVGVADPDASERRRRRRAERSS